MLVEKLVLTETNDENCYLVACRETGAAMIVDPGSYDERMSEFVLSGRRLELIFITHGHGDHTGGVPELRRRHGEAKLVMSADAGMTDLTPDRTVGGGDELRLGSLRGRIVDTPGHTPAGVSLILGGYVFCGDALFSGSVGGTRTRETFDQQIEAVRRELLGLPGETIVCCGHGPSSTIGVERRNNSFFVP